MRSVCQVCQTILRGFILDSCIPNGLGVRLICSAFPGSKPAINRELERRRGKDQRKSNRWDLLVCRRRSFRTTLVPLAQACSIYIYIYIYIYVHNGWKSIHTRRFPLVNSSLLFVRSVGLFVNEADESSSLNRPQCLFVMDDRSSVPRAG